MFIQALLIAAYVSIRQGQLWHGITWGMGYPIVSGIFIGIVLGDPMTGLKAGATINLAYLGWISAGGTQPGNICLAGVWGTSLTVLSGADPSLALTFAIPIGLFGLLIHQLYMTVNVFWVHQCDKYAAEGNMKKIVWGALIGPTIFAFIIYGLPTFLLVFLGQDFFMNMVSKIPESLNNALTVASGLIPAIGIAMLLNFLGKPKMMPFFFIGFFLSAYLGMPMIAITIFGACIAIYLYMTRKEEIEEGEVESHENYMEHYDYKIKLTKKDLVKHWALGLTQEANYNYERMQATGCTLAMLPMIKKLYKKEEDIKAALQRYMVFFNTEPAFIGTIIPGICASMEEQRANGAEITDETINGLRSSLMGPMAGIGDTIGQAIIYPIAASLGCSMALEGSYFGPVLFMLIFSGSMLFLGYNMYMIGYRQGKHAILKLLGNNTISLLTDAFAVVGLMVVGAMGAERVIANVTLSFSIGQTTLVLQELLDSIVLKLLPLATIMGTWALVRKRVNPTIVILIIFIVGVVLSFLGVLGA